jgi:alpha-tubulin suppressor-like RCC1 family protein
MKMTYRYFAYLLVPVVACTALACDTKKAQTRTDNEAIEGATDDSGAAFLCWGTLARPDSTPPKPIEPPEEAYFGGYGPICEAVDGQMYCLGNVTADMTATEERTKVARAAGFERVAWGSGHACGLLPDGGVECWGTNIVGQLGTGDAPAPDTAVKVEIQDGQPVAEMPDVENAEGDGRVTGLDDAVELVAGSSHNCARTEDGKAECWGAGYNGELGDGTTESRPYPGPVKGLEDVKQLAAIDSWNCAVLGSGKVACWGTRDSFPKSGKKQIVAEPTIVKGLTDIRQVVLRGLGRSSSDKLGYALDASGAVFEFDGTSKPETIAGLEGVDMLSAGAQHVCGLLEDGTVRCWGSNYYEQLGSEKDMVAKKIRKVPGVTGAKRLVSGRFFTCAQR